MSPVGAGGAGCKAEQDVMSADVTQQGTLGPETARKEAPCGLRPGLDVCAGGEGGGGQCPRGHLPPRHLSGSPRLAAQLLCLLSDTPACLGDSVFLSVKWAWPCASVPPAPPRTLRPFCGVGGSTAREQSHCLPSQGGTGPVTSPPAAQGPGPRGGLARQDRGVT